MHLQPLECQLAFYVDKRMVEFVTNTEAWLKTENHKEDPNLISNMTNLVNRIKRENPEFEFKINQLAVRQSTIKRDSNLFSMPVHKEEIGSDLELSDEDEVKQEENAIDEVPDLDVSDD